MSDIVWQTPDKDMVNVLKDKLTKSDFMGSDTSYVNLFLLNEKYDIKVGFYKEFLFRKYNGQASRNGYLFPIGNGNIKDALLALQEDSIYHNEKLRLCLLDEKQTKIVRNLSDVKFSVNIYEGDADYIYLSSELSELKGKKYQKKRNHISKFKRTYANYHYKKITDDNLADVLYISDKWICEKDCTDKMEISAIRKAVANFEFLDLFGFILYVDDKPVSYTIASKLNDMICDVHYEKALAEFARNGAYAVINNIFAKNVSYKFINREEDMGELGLRKAKRSYCPSIVLYKYYLAEE